MTRIQREMKKLEALQRQSLRMHIAMSVIVARQCLLWAGDTARQGYIAPSAFIEFAMKLKAPHKSLHPTEHGPRTRKAR